MLDMVVHPITQVIAHTRCNPFGAIAIPQTQYSGAQPKREQKKRRLDELPRLTLHESLIDHILNNAWNEKVKAGEDQQHEQSRRDLPEIWLEENLCAK
jgi:hypothetical protein